MIFGDFVPQANPPSQLTVVGLLLRGKRDRLPRERIVEGIHKLTLEWVERLPDSIKLLNSAVQQILGHSRVFCVSEKIDNVVMWSHYSDGHKGVVFKLRCIEELGNVLLGAEPVAYTNEFLVFPSADAYAKHLTGEQPFDYAPYAESSLSPSTPIGHTRRSGAFTSRL